MTNRTNDWWVGTAVLGTMVLVVAATMFLQGTDIGSRRPSVVARFREVGNLQVGNAVVIRGVRSGKVEEVLLASDGWVTARLTLEEGITLPSDPVVLIQAATLFGEWQAVITRRESVPAIREVLAQLADSSGAPPGALPGAVLPDIAQLTSVAGGIAGNVASVAERVRTAFDDSAARELRATMQNLNRISNDLARVVRSQTRNLDTVAARVLGGAQDLADGAAALQRSIGRIDSSTSSGEVSRIVSEAELAAQNLREAAQRVNVLSRSLAESEASFRNVFVRADTLLMRIENGQGSLGLLVNDASLYRNSDSLMIDLRLLIADLQKNPKRYFSLSIF